MAQFRWTGCILSCWALVAVPALCTSGWLLHPCACAESEHHDHDHEHEDLGGCGHEAECSADPCQLIVTRWDDDGLSLSDNCDIAVSPFPSLYAPTVDATGDPPIWGSPPAPPRASMYAALRTTILLI